MSVATPAAEGRSNDTAFDTGHILYGHITGVQEMCEMNRL